jgi:hypothetical protein
MSTAEIHPEAQLIKSTPLTRNQVRGFWASWGGWALDGMDSFIYALVLVPSLRELLPRSGIAATKGNIGYYGGLLFALFLCGWGLAFLWGPVGDRFGRVRTLMLTIVWYSVFTFLSALVTNLWQLATLRLLAGIGIGGEWAMGGTFVAEEWPENRRRAGAGYMHTGYWVGFFWRRWRTIRSGAALDGARCMPSADCRRCCWRGCGTVWLSPPAGDRKKEWFVPGRSGNHSRHFFRAHCGEERF